MDQATKNDVLRYINDLERLDNVACVDYSVAKGGILVAYRWDGEKKLSHKNFVWVMK
jgi:hypothetical protein